MKFNQAFQTAINLEKLEWVSSLTPQSIEAQEEHKQYIEILEKAAEKGAMFDARCFNIPVEEITNCFIWRQQDATRNAIQMLGQTHFSHKDLQNKSCNDIQDMLMFEKDINFNNMSVSFKRGVCCVKKKVPSNDRLIGYKTKWTIDYNIPVFSQDRDYIENILKKVGEN